LEKSYGIIKSTIYIFNIFLRGIEIYVSLKLEKGFYYGI